MISNIELAKKLASKGELKFTVYCFILGCLLQVALALVNKISNWYAYDSTREREGAVSPIKRALLWISDRFEVDVCLDIATTVAFLLAVFSFVSNAID